MFHYINRLLDVYFGIENTVESLNDPNIKTQINDKMTSGMEESLYKFIDSDKVEEYGGIETVKMEIDKQIPIAKEAMRKKYTEDYLHVILNQGLVMVCTVFETFLNDTFRTTVTDRAEVLNTLKQKKMTEILGKFNLGTDKENLASIQKQVIEKFYLLGIMKKIDVIEGIGIRRDKIFDFSSLPLDIQQTYKTWDNEKLQAIVKIRHDIVHRDELPLKTLRELFVIKYFFERLVINLSMLFTAEFHILQDIFQFMVERGAFKSTEDIKDFFKDIRQNK